MTRSKQTDPPRIRGRRRVRAPFASRRVGDLRTRRRHGLAAKLLGVDGRAEPDRRGGTATSIRVRAAHPRPGWAHPASREDIVEVLAQLGAARTYGICGVELRQAPAVTAHGALSFGRLAVPGRILLYEQPISPWSLAGALPAGMRRRLERAGAVIQRMAGGARTQVSWPGGTLRDFMRYDVLFHEVAHHILQQYTGKRTVRIRRTTDHERFADHFAARCRQDFESRAPLG